MMGQTCDPVGPENDDYIAQAAEGAKRIVCAWGAGVLPEHMSGPRRSWRCFSARPCVVSGPPKMDIPGIRSTCGGIKSLCPMECFRRWRSRSMGPNFLSHYLVVVSLCHLAKEILFLILLLVPEMLLLLLAL